MWAEKGRSVKNKENKESVRALELDRERMQYQKQGKENWADYSSWTEKGCARNSEKEERVRALELGRGRVQYQKQGKDGRGETWE